MNQNAVRLTVDQRRIAGQALVEMLNHQQTEVIVLALDAVHLHLLARFHDASIRDILGRAKKHATFELRSLGGTGRLWADRCRPLPITDREHQKNAYQYILDHARKSDAWTWTWKQGIYWRPDGFHPPAPSSQSS